MDRSVSLRDRRRDSQRPQGTTADAMWPTPRPLCALSESLRKAGTAPPRSPYFDPHHYLSYLITLDLHFMAHPRAIAAYLIEHTRGVAVVDPGPASCAAQFDEGLRARGYALSDVTDVLLTHIHFDHAGAAWRLAEAGATVHVHPVGYRHLLDPTRLYASATRIYGAEGMQSLWGPMRAIPESRLRSWDDYERHTLLDGEVLAVHTPGHAKHHIAWLTEGALFLGDVGGVRIGEGPTEPPCPPPDIDLEAWRQSLDKLRDLRDVETGYRTHFGQVEGGELPAAYDAVETGLERWLRYIRAAPSNDDEARIEHFVEAVTQERRDFGNDTARAYEWANPAYMSVTGLLRYLSKREVGSNG